MKKLYSYDDGYLHKEEKPNKFQKLLEKIITFLIISIFAGVVCDTLVIVPMSLMHYSLQAPMKSQLLKTIILFLVPGIMINLIFIKDK